MSCVWDCLKQGSHLTDMLNVWAWVVEQWSINGAMELLMAPWLDGSIGSIAPFSWDCSCNHAQKQLVIVAWWSRHLENQSWQKQLLWCFYSSAMSPMSGGINLSTEFMSPNHHQITQTNSLCCENPDWAVGRWNGGESVQLVVCQHRTCLASQSRTCCCKAKRVQLIMRMHDGSVRVILWKTKTTVGQ
jgi:hypothetical protein